MNRAKARDFFSDYYEGTLDRGLTQMFERALKQDALLREDYDSFCGLMNNLQELKDVEVPEPAFLHERIESRVNERLSAKKASTPLWWLGWGRLAFAGAAGVALLAVVITITTNPSGRSSTAGVLPEVPFNREMPPRLAMKGQELTLVFRPTTDSRVTLTAQETKEPVQTISLESDQLLRSPIRNESKEAKLLEISFSSNHESLFVALPGSQTSSGAAGSGTVKDLALVLADAFGKPVQIEAANMTQRLVWDIKPGDEVSDVSGELRPHGLSLEERADGILYLN